MQVLSRLGYAAWPVVLTELEQRYSDVGPAGLYIPTIESFAAWKTAAWFDRHAARDLYDLWAADRGHITPDAAALFVEHGPTHGMPIAFMFERPPTEREWTAQLANQTVLRVTAAQALDTVRHAWAAAVGDDWA